MATVPAPELLADHLGNPKPRQDTTLTYEEARLGVAFHEAGHAVLAMTYGFPVVSSEVIAWDMGQGGWGLTGNTVIGSGEVHAWRYAAMCAAGELANVRYLLVHGLWTPDRAAEITAEHDRALAVDMLAAHGFSLGHDHVPAAGKSWGQVRGMAARKVDRLWREIRTVAHAMNESTKLTGEQIAAMTGLTNAPMAGGAV
ncbi:hypothetical protein [Streptomyces sp. NPDC085479]|uniref:hypothetical protein n=1 Tax=Streptomyces sp. NPDC085479 TaxID=3365726 RepID=UPI0037D3F61D